MQGRGIMFYVSALTAIAGAVGYQFLVKRIPKTLNPVVSVLAVYVGALVLGMVLLPLFPAEGGLLKHIRQLNWIQLAIAGTVILLELGFLLMFRYGWDLCAGNLVTGAIVNVLLLGIGVLALGEKLSVVNVLGVVICIVGVALVGYRG